MHWIKLSSVTVLSLALIAAFGLHSVEFTHEHHAGGHTHQHQSNIPSFDIDEYVHGTEQKFFLVILVTFLALGLLIQKKPWKVDLLLWSLKRIFGSPQLLDSDIQEYNFLNRLFRKGILHSKRH